MATPSKKSPALTRALNEVFGRTDAIESDHCVPPPIGCGRSAVDFRDALSIREYTISGLCQECQDRIFQ